MSEQYVVGLDYGTNTARAVVVRCRDGAEIGTSVFAFPHGVQGVLTSPHDPELARQHPLDYLQAARESVRGALAQAQEKEPGFDARHVVGVGVDGTGSTPIPVDARGRALGESPEWADNLDALAWLWKDHTATEEAAGLTNAARTTHPEYLAKCGGAYSSEWFWAKMWHCANVAPDVARAIHGWVEFADWLPAILTGREARPSRGLCAAGHKDLYHRDWGGYPDRAFLASLHPDLARWRDALEASGQAVPINQAAGQLSAEWADSLGLPAGIPVAVGAIDAHLGAVGAGVGPGTLVKVMGTSTCDMMVAPLSQNLPDIPGLCGIVPESILPGYYGIEAGQSAVGDLFNWYVGQFGGQETHQSLTESALKLAPGASGLLALDWNNGNRTVLIDQKLTGLMLGQTLATTPGEIYRALIEATAFGARVIVERIEEYGVKVEQVVCCGGIAEKSPLTMQIYADVLNRPMRLSSSSQTCALGCAVAASVVAGVYPDIPTAQAAMTHLSETEYRPQLGATKVYDELFGLYRRLHDQFGTSATQGNLFDVMKTLLTVRDRARDGQQTGDV